MDDPDYTPRQVAELLSGGGVQLIDVRESFEYEAGHISGSRLISLSDLPVQAATIDPEQPIVIYCRSGGRSAMATAALRQAGFDAHDMVGGLLEWQADGLPLDPADGRVADH